MSTFAEQPISELGEFGLINQITRRLVMPPSVAVGPGDDAAVFLLNGSAVTTTDILIEGVHFRTDWSSAEQIGRKAVAVNVADIAAMGAVPVAMVIALAIPADTPASWVRQFVTGVSEEAELAKVALVGGDMSTARDITISVTVIGQTEGQKPVLRSGAQPADVVAIAGRLGWAQAGLAALKRGFRSPRAAVDAHRMPSVPYHAGRQAAKAGASAMIDVSDGLLADLAHICEASGVIIDLDSARFEIAEPVRTVASAINADPLNFVLTGGEDHALAACFPPATVPDDWQVVGQVLAVDDEGPRVLVDGKESDLEAGWRHFQSLS